MKKIFLASMLFAALGFGLTGCLKDDGFDDHKYGINDPDTQSPGVGFSLGGKTNRFGLNVADTPQVIRNIVYAAVFAGAPPQANVDISLTVNTQALVDKYNLANNTNVLVMPTTEYTLPSMTLTIPGGSYNVTIPITVANTNNLDPNESYAIGLTITSVTGNYTIAENLKNLLIVFNIKNKYDGVYTLTGYHNRTPYTFPYETEIHMVTAGPTSVAFYWPEVGSVGHPIGVAPNTTNWYGPSVAPVVVFDPVSNLVTDVYNSDATSVVITMFTGTGSRISKWDPLTKHMTVDWNYNGNELRAFFDDLEYIGPRP